MPVRYANILLTIVAAFLLQANVVFAQSEDDALRGMPLENTIIDRDIVWRLRGEVQFSDDSEELISDNAAYASFPATIYNADLTLIRRNRFQASLQGSSWENPQDLETTRWSWKVRTPVGKQSSLTFKQTRWDRDEDTQQDYLYLAVDTVLLNKLYFFTQYRNKSENGDSQENQLSEYFSWRAHKRFRVGAQGAIGDQQDSDDNSTWYVRAFSSFYLVPGKTTVRADARYYDNGEDLVFRDYNMYLYQRVGERALVRLFGRYYEDEEDLTSVAYGLKLKYYFAPRFSVHAGFRLYDHTEGADLETMTGGFNILF